MFCRKCGAPLPEDAEFCNKCGAKVFDSKSVSDLSVLADKAEEDNKDLAAPDDQEDISLKSIPDNTSDPTQTSDFHAKKDFDPTFILFIILPIAVVSIILAIFLQNNPNMHSGATPVSTTITILGVDIDELVYGDWEKLDDLYDLGERFLKEGESAFSWSFADHSRGYDYGDFEFITPADLHDGRIVLSMTLSDMSAISLGGVSLDLSRAKLRELMEPIAQRETTDGRDHYTMTKYELVFIYENGQAEKVTINPL